MGEFFVNIESTVFEELENKILLEFLIQEQERGFREGMTMKCPRCFIHDLDSDEAMNSVTRLNDSVYICKDCGQDEALADVGLFPQLNAYEWAIFILK